jgi:hypothetical protein
MPLTKVRRDADQCAFAIVEPNGDEMMLACKDTQDIVEWITLISANIASLRSAEQKI